MLSLPENLLILGKSGKVSVDGERLATFLTYNDEAEAVAAWNKTLYALRDQGKAKQVNIDGLIVKDQNLERMNLDAAHITNSHFERISFADASLKQVHLEDTKFHLVEFPNADFFRVDAHDCEVDLCAFIGTKFCATCFDDCSLRATRFTDFGVTPLIVEELNLKLGLDFQKTSFEAVVLRNIKLGYSMFVECEFEQLRVLDSVLHESVFLHPKFLGEKNVSRIIDSQLSSVRFEEIEGRECLVLKNTELENVHGISADDTDLLAADLNEELIF